MLFRTLIIVVGFLSGVWFVTLMGCSSNSDLCRTPDGLGWTSCRGGW